METGPTSSENAETLGKDLYERFMSPSIYQYLRKLQLQFKRQTGGKAKIPCGIIQPTSRIVEGIFLICPILVGSKGELIAIPNSSTTQIGKGSYGKVIYGIDLDTGKAVAVKEQEVPAEDAEKRLDIRNEMAVLDETGTLVASLETPAGIFIVDELAPGANYAQALNPLRIREDRQSSIEKLDMAIKFLQEVDKFHKRGYFHRDIKLSNMMWDPTKKKARLIDMGFAIKRNKKWGKFENKLISSEKLGTPIYTSPDIMTPRGQPATYSLKTEIFACGVAMMELFRPWGFEARDRQAWSETNNQNLPQLYKRFLNVSRQELPEDLKDVYDVMESMLQLENNKAAPSLSEMIGRLKTLKVALEYSTFNKLIQERAKFAITPEYMQNPKIKNILMAAAKKNDSKLLNLVTPNSSLYLLLLEAIKQKDIKSFSNMAQRFQLFHPANKGYADVIFKMIRKQAKWGKIDPFVKFIKNNKQPSAVTQRTFPVFSNVEGKTELLYVKIPPINNLTINGFINWPSAEHALLGQKLLAFRHGLVTTSQDPALASMYKNVLLKDIELVDEMLRKFIAMPVVDSPEIFESFLKEHADQFSLLAVPQGKATKLQALQEALMPKHAINEPTVARRPSALTWGKSADDNANKKRPSLDIDTDHKSKPKNRF